LPQEQADAAINALHDQGFEHAAVIGRVQQHKA